MAITSQFKDQARVIRKVKQIVRNAEGGYNTDTVIGPWFRCYYDPGTEDEERSTGSIRRRRRGAAVYAARRAKDGSLVDLKAEDSLEINSIGHGVLAVDVVGKPERAVRGRTVVCWIASVGKTNRQSPG